MNKLFFLLFPVFFLLYSCEDKYSDFGIDVLPDDYMLSSYKDSIVVLGYNDNNFRINAKNPEYSFIGTYTDPIFGKTDADLILQYYPYTIPWKLTFGHNIVDSAFVILPVTSFVGDSNTVMSLSISAINDTISYNEKYYTNEDLDKYKLNNIELSNEFRFYKDSLVDSIRIPIMKKFGQKLLSDTSILSSDFVKTNKGLLLKASIVSGSGALLKLHTISSDAYIRLYYHLDTISDTIAYTADFEFKLTATDSYSQTLYILSHLNGFKHDYSGTVFQNSYDDVADSTIYIQGLGGTNGLIKLPPVAELKEIYDQDTFIIQKAYLQLPVSKNFIKDSVSIINSKLALASKLYIGYKKSDGTFSLISDYDDNLVDGNYYKSSLSYTLNISRYLQEYIGGKRNGDLYLFTESSYSLVNGSSIDPRAEYSVFNSSATIIDAKNIKLRFKYSKYIKPTK